MIQIEVVHMARRAGKTTQALIILKSNDKSIMFIHGGLRVDHPILYENPELKRRIFPTTDYRQRLRGMIVDTIIIDNAEFIPTALLLGMIKHFTEYPINMGNPCRLIMTTSNIDVVKPEDEEDCFRGWDHFAKESMINCASVFIEEGHGEPEYKFCELSIMNAIHYLKSKRNHEKEAET